MNAHTLLTESQTLKITEKYGNTNLYLSPWENLVLQNKKLFHSAVLKM